MPIRVIVEQDGHVASNLEQMVDEDLSVFDDYFQEIGNDPLTRFEKAAIKTYLHYKTHGKSLTATADLYRKTHGEPDAKKAAG